MSDEKGGPAPVVTIEEYEHLKQQAQQAEQYQDQLLRLQAEFDNTRKRWLREQQEFERRAGDRVLAQFLEIVDDFERALAVAPQQAEAKDLRVGVEMIHLRIVDFLKGHGVEAFGAAGQPFDPGRHEAVEHVATPDHPESTVIEVLRKGYARAGRVIRPATVKVAVRPSATAERGA